MTGAVCFICLPGQEFDSTLCQWCFFPQIALRSNRLRCHVTAEADGGKPEDLRQNLTVRVFNQSGKTTEHSRPDHITATWRSVNVQRPWICSLRSFESFGGSGSFVRAMSGASLSLARLDLVRVRGILGQRHSYASPSSFTLLHLFASCKFFPVKETTSHTFITLFRNLGFEVRCSKSLLRQDVPK